MSRSESTTFARGLRTTQVARSGGLVFALLAGLLLWLVPAHGPTPLRGRIGSVHEIEVTGDAHVWRVRYPGADGVLGTADDIAGRGDLHLPVGVPTRVLLHSQDYIYSLRVPSLALNEVAVPDMEFELRIEAQALGSHVLEGGEMCGTPPPGLQGHVVVQSEADYWDALQRQGLQ